MNQTLSKLYSTVFVLFVIVAGTTHAQENLLTILERGYPTQWLLCAPFDSDLEQGILEAAANAQNPLGRNDFMASLGGTENVRPVRGLEVTKENGVAVWLSTRSDGSTVDLSPFFPQSDSGIAFAAFYANSLSEKTVLFNLQSALGARVFLNGLQVREVGASPLSLSGVDEFVATFQPGANLLLLEVPGVKIEALAAHFAAPFDTFTQNQFQNRSALEVKTGFEFNLTMKPMKAFSKILYDPSLENTGTFNGRDDTLFQDTWLTIFNPGDTPSPEFAYSATAVGATKRITKTIPAIPPNSPHRERISIPVGRRTPGQPVRVNSMLSIGRDTERWATEVMVSQKPSPAHFHVVATPYISDASTNSQATVLDTYNEDLYTNILRAQENPEFGFSLGPAELWYPILATHPSYKQKLAERIKNKSVAPWNTYSEIDERVADGEAIIRNLWFGTTLAEKWLSATPNTYWAWNAPAVAPQTPQILKDAGISGIIHNLPYKGLPGIYDQLAPDGSRMLNRRKANSPALKSILNLHQTARSQHRFWEALGIESDLLIRENTGRSSESFWMDKSLPLTNAFPPITVTGSGGEEYFDSLQQERAFQFANTPLLSRNTTRHAPWDLLLYPELNNLYIHNRAQLHTSEMFATFNAFHGTPYPFAKLNDAWKKLLYLSHPDRTSSEQSETNYLDHLDVHRSLNKITTPILDGTLQGIANRVNTASTDISSLQGTQAIVVFNATSQTRTNLVSVVLELTNAQGLTVLDLSGNSVPFETRDVLVKSRTLTRATVTFLAESVPSVGYTTYYAVPTGALAQPKELYTPYIENEYLQIHMNGGEIERIVDKTGQLPEQSGLSFNEIVAYHLDPDYPEVLWNHTITRSSDQPSKVQYESTPLGQRVIVTTPFLEGEITRTLTLYKGIPWIDVSLETNGIQDKNTVLGVEFAPISKGLRPLIGLQYTGLFASEILPSTGLSDTSGAPYPPFSANISQGYHALAIPPHLKTDDNQYVPIEPAQIIHSGLNSHNKVAKELQAALLQRGIPSSSLAKDELLSKSLWPDDTQFDDFNDDLGIGTLFRFLIGSPQENPLTAALLGQLSESTQQEVRTYIEDAKPIFVYDNNVPFGHDALPTLIISGRNINETETLVHEIAVQIREEKSISLDPAQFLPTQSQKKPAWAPAILHSGVAPSRLYNKTFTHFLGRTRNGTRETDSDTMSYRYALYPYNGNTSTTRLAHVAQAYNSPLIAVQTDLHAGSELSSSSFLAVSNDDFLVTNIHPKIPEASLFSAAETQIEAIMLRGFDTSGNGGEVTVNLEPTVYAMANHTPLETEKEPISTVSGDVRFKMTSNDIKTVAIYTAPTRRRPQEDSVEPTRKALSSQSWKRNSGPGEGASQAVSVRIIGPIPTPSGTVRIEVSNNSPYEAFTGELSTIVSRGWSVSPRSQALNLQPGRFKTLSVTVSRENSELVQWGILAQIDHGDDTLFDVATNFEYPIEISSDQLNNEYMIVIRNQGGLPIVGTAQLFTDFDTREKSDSMLLKSVPFHVQPYQEKRIVYKNSGPNPPNWAYAKVNANNQTFYHKFSLDSQ